VGWEGLEETLAAVTTGACEDGGIGRTEIAGAGFGIAGYDWPGELEGNRRAIEALELPATCSLVNDTIIGLIAGASKGWGIGVVSGTGSNCWGRDWSGREGHTTGGAGMFGEYAGGSDIVARAVQDVARAWTMRGPRTLLTDLFIAEAEAEDEVDLLEGLYLGHYTLTATAAPLVFQAAADGDAVAQAIIQWAGRELGSLAVGVIRQLGFEHIEFQVVQIGSVFNGSPLLGETMMAAIHEVATGARAVRPTVPPVVGGVLLAMERAGIDYLPLRPTLIASTAAVLPHTGSAP